MQLKRLKLSMVLMLGLLLPSVQAQTMHVSESNGTKTAYTLSSLRKMSFSAGNVTLTKNDNSSGVYPLNVLSFLYFSDISTSLDMSLINQEKQILTYPNPVKDVLYVDLTGATNLNGTIKILSLEGKTLKTQNVTNSELISVDISRLPEGVYLCCFSNVNELKTVKFIKK